MVGVSSGGTLSEFVHPDLSEGASKVKLFSLIRGSFHKAITATIDLRKENWLEREIAQWVHPMKDQSDDPSHHERTLSPHSYISFLNYLMVDFMAASFNIYKLSTKQL